MFKRINQLIKVVFLLFFSINLYGQDSLNISSKNIGVEYFGELVFHPGIRLDIGFPFWTNKKFQERKNQSIQQQLILRPKIGYYNIYKYTNNFFIGSDLTLQFRTIKPLKKKVFYFESNFGLGYLRYAYIGTIYESTTNGSFEERNTGGGNALMVSTGFLVGGSLPIKDIEWIAGVEYFFEFSEDKLIIQHPSVRLGFRINLKR